LAPAKFSAARAPDELYSLSVHVDRLLHHSSAIGYNVLKLSHLSRWSIEMLTNEMKRQVFLKLRTENYRASLRLEGLVQRTVEANKPAVEVTAATLKTKHGR
ncbi:MAG: YhfG family protein, partial [Pseudomonadota bacterium]